METVHRLRFTDRAELTRAFQEIVGSEYVEDCVVETDALELHFLAPAMRADRLIERIYLSGGLVWSSRHPLLESSPGAVR